jgi:hypothetical protein
VIVALAMVAAGSAPSAVLAQTRPDGRVQLIASGRTARVWHAPRLERVVLLPTAGRLSIVLEMSEAAGAVRSRRVSADLFEVEAGPARVDRAQAYTAPGAASAIATMIVDGTGGGDAMPMLRARITLRRRCASTVRVEGRRIYIDISVPASNVPVPSPRAPQRARHSAPVAAVSPAASAHDTTGEASLRAAFERFGDLLPFVTSAASAPGPAVLSALSTPLADLRRSVRELPRAEGVRSSEDLLATATTALSKAVDPGYAGNRLEQVHQAVVFFTEAKRESEVLEGGTPSPAEQ